MIKKLRRKFIFVIMAIVTVLMGLILGVMIYFSAQSMEIQSVSMMRAVASIPFEKEKSGPPPMDKDRPPAFVVQISSDGEIIVVEHGGSFVPQDGDFIQRIVDSVLNSDQESGKLRRLRLRFLKDWNPMGITIVFTDTSTEDATLRSLARTYIVIFFVSSLIFLCITIGLSHWVIKPVETAWEQQRQFVADASHELKTPLSVIMANAELLQNEDTGEEDRKKYSGNILSVSYQMRSLVENMLEMARVDNGTATITFTGLDFSQLVRDAVLSFQLLYEEKGLCLQCTVPDGISVKGSEQHLYQLMDVLLDNGLKYSTPEGPIHINLKSTGHSCHLSVATPGDPISKEDLVNIFKRFYRADKARAMNGSCGLGLSIAESIVEAHKGKIWAESRDGYNIFHVQLPLK